MDVATRAPEFRGNELEHNFGELEHSSNKPYKTKGFNHIRILNEIAEKWVSKGCYKTKGRVFEALIGGDL